jgi:hypothetical protein
LLRLEDVRDAGQAVTSEGTQLRAVAADGAPLERGVAGRRRPLFGRETSGGERRASTRPGCDGQGKAVEKFSYLPVSVMSAIRRSTYDDGALT